QELIHHQGQFANFEAYAADVLEQFPGISNLQLAPGGIIRNIYPLRGNEQAIGYDILGSGSRDFEPSLIDRTRGLTLDGPFELVQGGIGVVGQNPVFIPFEHGEEFWGFASALILLDDLLERSGLNSLASLGYAYELARIHPANNTEIVFSRGEGEVSDAALSVGIVVPNGSWVLRIEDIVSDRTHYQLGGYLLSLLLALGLATYCQKIITEPDELKKQVELQTRDLHKLAYHDSLTGLTNRLSFNEGLQNYVRAVEDTSDSVAVLLIDLDQFKEINDTKGHDYGDLLLIEFANRVSQVLPEFAEVSRLGGDEFVITLHGQLSIEINEQVAADVMSALVEPFQLGTHQVFVGCSIGIAMLGEHIRTPTELLKSADLAMYEAKNMGRACYFRFSDSLQLRSQRRIRLIADLKCAIENDELRLLYQPIYSYKSGKIEKTEALIRWEHPELGTISPLEFIPLAESSDSIVGIGDWIFKTAVNQVKQWQEKYYEAFQISINVSPRQFRSEEHVVGWIGYLKLMGVSGSSIIIEITEGILLNNDRQIQQQLNKLRSVGIQFALDDFGTGYSSLSYLKTFPIDYLKIDKSFIENLENESEDLYLCEIIIKIANRFGLLVVAEGVENRAQYDLLVEHNCHFAQGYYFSRPVEASELEANFLADPLFGYARSGDKAA
nr:EAL domain-containing protein [Gammaproteobacteria bacterium]